MTICIFMGQSHEFLIKNQILLDQLFSTSSYSGSGGRRITVWGKVNEVLSKKQAKSKRTVGMAQAVKHLPHKYKTLSSVLNTTTAKPSKYTLASSRGIVTTQIIRLYPNSWYLAGLVLIMLCSRDFSLRTTA
jgi:hypothetical protein